MGYAFAHALEDVGMAELIVPARQGAQREEVDGIVFDPRGYLVR
jgi:hypothetical protein